MYVQLKKKNHLKWNSVVWVWKAGHIVGYWENWLLKLLGKREPYKCY